MRLCRLAFSIAVAGLLISCHKDTGSGVQVDEGLARLIPSDVPAVSGIDLARLKAAPFYQRHSDSLNIPILDQAGERIGLDPRRDVESVLIAFEKGQPLVLVRGAFSSATVEKKLTALGARRTQYKDRALYSDGTQAVFFPNLHTAVAGADTSLQGLIDKTGSNNGISAGLMSRLATLSRSDELWLASDQTFDVKRLPLQGNVESALSSLAGFVNGSAVGIGVDSGIHVEANLWCVSDKGAEQVQNAIRGLIGLARLNTRDDQRSMLRVYDAFQVLQDHSMVQVRADLPPDLSDTLFTLVQGIAGSRLRSR